MIKHIVMWTLHDAQTAQAVKERLEDMRGRIPCLLKLEVGVDFLHSAQSADVVLIATLKNQEALDNYQQHPVHQAIIPFMQSVAASRVVIDYDA